MSAVPPHAAALAVVLAAATKSEPRVTETPHIVRIEADLPDDLGDVVRATILTALGNADRYGHVHSTDGDTVWAEIDRKAPPVTTTQDETRPGNDDAAYKVLLGHTLTCAGCRTGTPCPTAVRLGRAWRQDRR